MGERSRALTTVFLQAEEVGSCWCCAALTARSGPEERIDPAGNLELGAVRVRCFPVAHTSHPAYGHRIEAPGLAVV
jgi:hypothetical protein